ncbi:hypothetical protein [Burkholderia cepacia]|uniref:hypothetical protein n=1 Tax=Burkholderia cepacia TaxID=292 RepID=UPI000F55F0B2|nr:hypothetical protein [Burkholderia cepacia]RQT81340.1 hypothetical protein DF023_22450 [Burkholderia cepacia]RQU00693.1 hypothetical protein DF022_22830 [Burkholderia cepacia]
MKKMEQFPSFQQRFAFDRNQLDRINQLMLLKGLCLEYQNKLELRYEVPSGSGLTSFYCGISDEVDALVYNFVNDEIATCLDGRGPSRQVFRQIAGNTDAENINKLNAAFMDFERMTAEYRDHYVGRCYLDFMVGTYSVFETWITRIRNALMERNPRAPSQRMRKLRELVEQYPTALDAPQRDAILERIAKLMRGQQSSAGIVDFVFSKISTYSRPNAEQDRSLIRGYAALRNSVHNMGVSESKDDHELVGEGFEITLPKGLSSYTQDHSDRTRACAELVKIYTAVVDSLDLAGHPCCMDVQPCNP